MRMVHFNKSTLISNVRKCEVMAGTETKGPDISIILILQRKCQIWSRTSWPGHTSLFDLSFIENSLGWERNAWMNLDKQSNCCLCCQTCRWPASSWSRSTSRLCGSCAWRAWRTSSSCSTSPPTSSSTAQSPCSSRLRSPRSAGSSVRRPPPHSEVSCCQTCKQCFTMHHAPGHVCPRGPSIYGPTHRGGAARFYRA